MQAPPPEIFTLQKKCPHYICTYLWLLLKGTFTKNYKCNLFLKKAASNIKVFLKIIQVLLLIRFKSMIWYEMFDIEIIFNLLLGGKKTLFRRTKKRLFSLDFSLKKITLYLKDFCPCVIKGRCMKCIGRSLSFSDPSFSGLKWQIYKEKSPCSLTFFQFLQYEQLFI